MKKIYALILFLSFNSLFAAANRAYVTNAGSASVSVINTHTNTVIGSPIPVGVAPQGLAVTPDGAFVYVANKNSDSVSVIDAATNTVVTTVALPLLSQATNIAITPDGSEAWVVCAGSSIIRIIDTLTNMLIPATISISGVTDIVMDPNGNLAYASSDTGAGAVYQIDTISKMAVASVNVTEALDIGISPDGSTVYVAGFFSNSLFRVDAATMTVIPGSTPIGMNSRAIALTPDGTTLYSANQNGGNVSAVDTATLTVTAINTSGSHFGAAVMPSGLFAYATDLNGFVDVIDVATNTIVTSIPMMTSQPFGVAISPIFTPGSPPVTALFGNQQKEDSGLEYQLFNTLNWEANPATIVGFFVYRNGVKIATLDATTFQYVDNNRKKGETTLYSVTTFNADGDESVPVTIEIK